MWRKPTQYEIDIFHIACEYMAKTELYDRSLPKIHNGSAIHPQFRQSSNLYAINLRKKLTKDDYFIWKDVRECIKRHNYVTEDWWIEQWKMWREIVSVEIKGEDK